LETRSVHPWNFVSSRLKGNNVKIQKYGIHCLIPRSEQPTLAHPEQHIFKDLGKQKGYTGSPPAVKDLSWRRVWGKVHGASPAEQDVGQRWSEWFSLNNDTVQCPVQWLWKRKAEPFVIAQVECKLMDLF
jgi:hypothetical protein